MTLKEQIADLIIDEMAEKFHIHLDDGITQEIARQAIDLVKVHMENGGILDG